MPECFNDTIGLQRISTPLSKGLAVATGLADIIIIIIIIIITTTTTTTTMVTFPSPRHEAIQGVEV
jgi:hypothetical protein